MPDGSITWNDLVRGEITFETEFVPDFALCRANGDPLYTLVNPVDDATDGDHPRAARRGPAVQHAAPDRAVRRAHGARRREGDARVRPPALRDGRGQQEALQARPAGPPARSTATRASCPRGCSTTSPCSAGRSPRTATSSRWTRWSRRSTSRTSTPTRRASTSRRPRRSTPRTCGCCRSTRSPTACCRSSRTPASSPTRSSDADAQLLELAMPLVAERINKLTEAVDDARLPVRRRGRLHPRRGRRREAARRRPVAASSRRRTTRSPGCTTWSTAAIQEALQAALVEGMGLKPRNAFGPVRVAVTGGGSRRRCSSRWSCSAASAAWRGCRARWPDAVPAGRCAAATYRPRYHQLPPAWGRPGWWRSIVGVVLLARPASSPSCRSWPAASPSRWLLATGATRARPRRVLDVDDGPTPAGLAYLNLALAARSRSPGWSPGGCTGSGRAGLPR